MKKLFTLLTLLVAIVTGAWAQDATTPSFSSSNWTSAEAVTAVLANHETEGVTIFSTQTSSSNYSSSTVRYLAMGASPSAFDGSQHFGIKANSAIIDSVAIQFAVNGSGDHNIAYIGWEKGKNPSNAVDVHGVTPLVTGSKSASDLKWQTIDVHGQNISEIRVSRQWKSLTEADGTTKISNFGGNKTINISGVKIWLKVVGPQITKQPESASYVTGQTIAALTVEATPATATFQWYSCDDTNKTNAEPIEGETSSSYTPSAAGFYYVAVTDGGVTVNSDVAEITVSAATAPNINATGAPTDAVKVGAEVVLTATATGVPTPTITWYNGSNEPVATEEATELTYTVPTTAAGTYTFYATADNKVGTPATTEPLTIVVKEQVAKPTISPNGAYFEESQDVELSATEDATILYSTDNGATWNTYSDKLTFTETTTIKVKATKDGMIDSEEATATFNKVTLVEQTSISEATTWDFSKYGTKEIGTNGTPFYRNDVLVANVAQYGKAAAAADFGPATALVLNGDFIVRDTKFCQVTHAKFKTTVPGTLKVVFSNTGSDTRPYRYLYVNGVKTEYASNTSKSNTTAEGIQVNSGEVDLYGVLDPEADNADAGQVTFIRIYSIEFTPLSAETLILGEQGGNADKISAAAGTTKNVFVDRKISNEYYNTLFLPFALTTAQINTIFGEGTKVAKYKGLKSNGTTFLFENVTTDMEANVGYLVKPANTVNGFSVEGATIVKAGNISVTDFAMLGTYDTFGNKAGNVVYYFTTEGKMKKLSDTGKIKGLRAMLAKIQNGAKTVSTLVSNVDLNPVIEGGNGGARAREEYFVEFVDDASVVTAIEAIDNSQLTIDNDAPAYNLAGQKVGKGYKGIVIINGKKVVK